MHSHNPSRGSERLVTLPPATVRRKESVPNELAVTSLCVTYKGLQCACGTNPKAVVGFKLQNLVKEHHLAAAYF